MELRNIVHIFYKSGRTLVRATGLTGPARKLLGPAAGRFVYRRSANADGSLMVQGRKMFLAPEGSYPSPDMVVDRYEKATTDLFRQLLKPGMVVVDVGANVGYFSLLAAELVGDSGKVYAFEPEPGNNGVLRKNIDINSISNIQVEEKAVSDSSGTAEFFLSELDSGSHSLYGEAARGVREHFQVTTTTIDEFHESEGWPNVDLIKIDVEGGELGVLKGMESLMEKTPDVKLIIEYCPFLIEATGAEPSDLLDRLYSKSYQIQFIDDKKGVLPLDSEESDAITARLLKQKTYINILCSHR